MEERMPAFDVVFIDDEVTLTEIFQYFVLIHYKDWRFTTFSNASMAYDQIVNHQLSAAVWIVDMMMPGKNGAQIAEAIRANQNGDIPVVLAYTALDRNELARYDEYKNGIKYFSGVINKREDLPDLLSLVDTWVVQSRQVHMQAV
jgi:CheY-like chemotaxis protein